MLVLGYFEPWKWLGHSELYKEKESWSVCVGKLQCMELVGDLPRGYYFLINNHFRCSLYRVLRALLEGKDRIVGGIGTSHSIAPGSLLALCSGIDVIQVSFIRQWIPQAVEGF